MHFKDKLAKNTYSCYYFETANRIFTKYGDQAYSQKVFVDGPKCSHMLWQAESAATINANYTTLSQERLDTFEPNLVCRRTTSFSTPKFMCISRSS